MDTIKALGDLAEKFSRYTFLENYPDMIDTKKNEKFKAYIWREFGSGITLLEFDDCVEVFASKDGPYEIQGLANSFEEARALITNSKILKEVS